MKYNPKSDDHRKVLAQKIKDKLNQCGFAQEQSDYDEIIYSREVIDTDCKVLVFTSIGKRNNQVRMVGSDAIRVCSIDKDERGVTKNKRVNRTGDIEDIIERMYQRMRNSYKETLSVYKIKCSKCGANTFLSKKGNRVCSEVCWSKNENKDNNKDNKE